MFDPFREKTDISSAQPFETLSISPEPICTPEPHDFDAKHDKASGLCFLFCRSCGDVRWVPYRSATASNPARED